MRKNILMFLTGCLATMTISASNTHHNADSIYKQNTFSQEQMLLPMNPTYLKNVSDWEDVGRAHGEFFGTIKPACTMIAVSSMINPEMLVEIEATAIIS